MVNRDEDGAASLLSPVFFSVVADPKMELELVPGPPNTTFELVAGLLLLELPNTELCAGGGEVKMLPDGLKEVLLAAPPNIEGLLPDSPNTVLDDPPNKAWAGDLA